jgi:hypothetical protein
LFAGNDVIQRKAPWYIDVKLSLCLCETRGGMILFTGLYQASAVKQNTVLWWSNSSMVKSLFW